MNEIQSSKLRYITAWLLASFLSNLGIRIADNILATNIIKNLSDLNTYFITVAVVGVPIISGSFIFIYNIFKTLNVKKIMVYIYILGGLGTLAGIASTSGEFIRMGVDLNIYFLSTIISWVTSVYIIRYYYIKKTDRWF